MEEENKNIIKFEMSGLSMFLLYKFFTIGQWITWALFIFLVINAVIAKYDLIYTIKCSFILCGILSLGSLLASLKIRRIRFASQLIIDKEKKEFCSYIYSLKKRIRFGVNDIQEVNRAPDMLKFCLKDGTWFTWIKDNRNESAELDQEILENIIKTFGISIKDKKFF